jgi:hypothetical protein
VTREKKLNQPGDLAGHGYSNPAPHADGHKFSESRHTGIVIGSESPGRAGPGREPECRGPAPRAIMTRAAAGVHLRLVTGMIIQPRPQAAAAPGDRSGSRQAPSPTLAVGV